MDWVDHYLAYDSPQMITVKDHKKDEPISLLRSIVIELEKTNQYLKNVVLNTKQSSGKTFHREDRVESVSVFISISVLSIGDIDAIKQDFQCEFYMQVRWTEPLLFGRSNSDDVDWEDVWDPNIHLIHAVGFDVLEKSNRLIPSLDSKTPPDIIQYFHIKGTFKEVLEVNEFPYDYQDLTLVLTSNWAVDQINLLKDPHKNDNIRTWNFTARQEWDLQQHVLVESTENIPEEGSSPNIFPLYKVQLHVMRQYGFYLYNVALIMCLITALTFSSFAVKVDSIGDRIQITLTLLLTSVAFKYYVQQFVPTVSYLTLMDKYILSCMIFQFAMAAIHNSVAGLITNAKALIYFEWSCFGLALTVFIVIHIVFAIISLKYVVKNKKRMRADKERYRATNPPQEKISNSLKKPMTISDIT
ncbi:glycine receptor subunit alpha-3-like isoform X2 [Rhopilema esculentum]|uniref:glycine receptor subunit alpha-3-like isoform X2 n=1 Tax=Rhopilema esculentum TaxID=499914 RepID=UPI0031DB3FD5